MNLAAYVLLGDPAWLVPSISSYYDAVSTIVASYDEELLSWAGEDLAPEITACIRLLEVLDRDNKVVLAPGSFSRPLQHPTVAETAQRQAAIDAASPHGDWVVQLDTDEVVTELGRFVEEIRISGRSDVDALEYPSRWLYAHIRGRWFLERCTRRLRIWDAVPGPLAVRAGTQLAYCRQAEVPTRRLRFSTGAERGGVALRDGVLHFSMVRTSAAMKAKSSRTAHAKDLDWGMRLGLWEEARRSPSRAVVRSLLTPHFGSYRPTRLPAGFNDDLVARETALGDPSVVSLLRGRTDGGTCR